MNIENIATLDFIKLVTKPYRKYIYINLVVIILFSLYASLRPYLLKEMVNSAAGSKIGVFPDQLLYFTLLYYLVSFMLSNGWRVYHWCTMQYQPKMENYITKIIYEYISLHDYLYFQNRQAGALSSKALRLTHYIQPIIEFFMNQFVMNLFSISIALIFMFYVNPYFALGGFIWTSFIITISYLRIKTYNNLSKEQAETNSKIGGFIVDSITNILNVKLFSARNSEIETLSTYQEEYRKAAYKRMLYLFKFSSIIGITFLFYQAFCVYLLIILFEKGQVSPGDFVMIITINNWIIDNMYRLSDQMSSINEYWGNVEQSLETLTAKIDIKDMEGAKELRVTKGEIKFDSVEFSYKGSEKLFADKTVLIKSGEKVGLVGYSGGGKTSFVNLILRIFEVDSGKILIDGQDIREVTGDSLRAAIGMIPQDPSLFHRSLKDNIGYAKPDAEFEKIVNAAKKANAHSFIDKLPEKYNSLVGERGIKLSGGQRQRIAIARAFLKNAPILIMDEATSQLDSVTEKMIRESLMDLMQNKTTIVIAHRLSTLLNMDRILVFENGKIVEDGSHQKLLQQGGVYKSLWDAQIGDFLPSAHNPE